MNTPRFKPTLSDPLTCEICGSPRTAHNVKLEECPSDEQGATPVEHVDKPPAAPVEDTSPPVKPMPLALVRRIGEESIFRPQYKKWAADLLANKPIRLLTTHDRVICFLPSAIFPDNGGMPIGTLIVCYGGTMYQGYVELDFTKKPNPFFLNMKGFPMKVGVLICQTIYAMFPHLNPLSEEDIRTLTASKTRRGAKSTLRLTAPKRKHDKVQIPAEKQNPAPALPPAQDTKPIETQDYATRKTKQREKRPKQASTRKTRSKRPEETKLPDVQGGGTVRNSGQSQ